MNLAPFGAFCTSEGDGKTVAVLYSSYEMYETVESGSVLVKADLVYFEFCIVCVSPVITRCCKTRPALTLELDDNGTYVLFARKFQNCPATDHIQVCVDRRPLVKGDVDRHDGKKRSRFNEQDNDGV